MLNVCSENSVRVKGNMEPIQLEFIFINLKNLNIHESKK